MRIPALSIILFVIFSAFACNGTGNPDSPGALPSVGGHGEVSGGLDLCPDPVGPKTTRLFYTGLLSVRYGHLLPLSALLTDDGGAALAGKTVTFQLGGRRRRP